jgi:hypothetical protein
MELIDLRGVNPIVEMDGAKIFAGRKQGSQK